MRKALLGAPLIWASLGLGIGAHGQAIDLAHGGPVTITAAGGIDWNQGEKTVTAHGDARAIRGNATLTSDKLIARYRAKAHTGALPGPVAAVPADKTALPGSDTGGNEIYRLNAEGGVHIFTQTDQAFADHAVYDIDEAVVVLTGGHLKMTTPTSILTARDTIEYWPKTKLAVARGDAVVTTTDARRVAADVLVAYLANTPAPGAAPASTAPVKPASGDKAADALTGGKLDRVEAYGHVEVRTLTDIVTGDRGLYLPPTGIARVLGHVHITRGANQLNGAAAIVNMKTGIASLTQAPGERVQGLVVPNAPQPPTSKNTPRPAGTP